MSRAAARGGAKRPRPSSAPRPRPAASPGRGPRSATWLYALVAAPGEPSAAGAPEGPPGLGPLRWLPVGEGLWLAAADAPLPRYAARAVEEGLKDLEWVSACAVAHERVVEHAATQGTAVPMKLFTLFSTDARAVEHLSRSRPKLRKVLKRLSGRQEWGVRVSVDEASARAGARSRAETSAAGLSAGARFLARKSREQGEVRDVVRVGREEAEAVFEEAARHADETRRREAAAARPGVRLLLDAAFLVPRERTSAFQQALRRHRDRLAPRGYVVVLTGPWPPYNFVAEAG